MSRPIQRVSQIDPEQYSEIIDVRSPAEFAIDHVPGARNFYVLDNDQRAEIGTIYKQVNAFEAKKRGASLVSANISRWIAEELLDKPRDYRPLIYCWRGGQRSGSFATVLSNIGWEVTLVEGGYKRYRHQVIECLESAFASQPIIILTGLTGTRKTDLLTLLEQAGEQVLDLEGLARHRGSLLGSLPGNTQPAQKFFESLIAAKVRDLDPHKPLWIEAESNKIGNLYCPLPLWSAMQQAPQIGVTAPLQARIGYLLETYQAITANPAALKEKLGFLRERHGKQCIENWYSLIDERKWEELVADLLIRHYDPAYRQSTARNNRVQLAQISLDALASTDLIRAVGELQAMGSWNDPVL
ncbi:MAG: tRNA 2-selenouridine(34) synthase MnmH [Thiotrichales bacterium]